MKYHFRFHPEDGGYWAECIEISGCLTQGDTWEELEFNMREALDLTLDEPADSKEIFPKPKKGLKGRRIVEVPVSPKVALAARLRMARLARGLTQKKAAQLMGMRGLYSYQRLESSKTANPEFETLNRLKKVFPEISVDSLFS